MNLPNRRTNFGNSFKFLFVPAYTTINLTKEVATELIFFLRRSNLKNYLLFIAIGLIIFTASFNAYKAYSVLPKETEMLTAIQLRLQNDSPILLIEKSSLFDTDITVVLFEQEERNSFALFKSNRLNDKLKLSLVQPTIQEDQRMLLKQIMVTILFLQAHFLSQYIPYPLQIVVKRSIHFMSNLLHLVAKIFT